MGIEMKSVWKNLLCSEIALYNNEQYVTLWQIVTRPKVLNAVQQKGEQSFGAATTFEICTLRLLEVWN